jgi:threonine dehydrogenase-like Zn-dependent dehydrogenase
MNKDLTVNMGNCNHRRYMPTLIDLVASGRMSLAPNLTQQETMETIVDAYEAFDRRQPGWGKGRGGPLSARGQAIQRPSQHGGGSEQG